MTKPIIIAIAGGTASGKTTIAKNLEEVIRESKSVVRLELDNYYMEEAQAKEQFKSRIVNWDDPRTIDWDRVVSDLDKLASGQSITFVPFNHEQNAYVGEEVTLEPAEAVIIEGIFALTRDDVINRSQIRIYVSADADVRLIRRAKRDGSERHVESFDNDAFMERWLREIKPSHERFIEPTKKSADFIVNTTDIAQDKIVDRIRILLSLGK